MFLLCLRESRKLRKASYVEENPTVWFWRVGQYVGVPFYSEQYIEQDFIAQRNVEIASSADHYVAETCVVNYEVLNETRVRGVDKSRR